MKETEDDTNTWKDIPCSSWIGRINIVKTTILPKTIYRLMQSLKLPMAFFTELEQKFCKFVWKHKRPQIVKTIEKEEQSWRNHTS